MPKKIDIDSTIEDHCNESRCALVIGNSSYDQRPLHNPGNDAIAIASKLEACSFDVQLELDLDLQAFNTAIRLFGKRLRENGGGVGLVFYSGHGIQIGGTNYLLPLDFNATEEADAKGQAIQADRLIEHMDSAGCNLNLIILDACRDNPLISGTRSLTRGLAVMSAKGDTLIIYATEPNGVAQDGKKGFNSVFTSALLKVIDIPNMPIEQAIKIVTKIVQEETNGKQRPWSNQSITRDFYFFESLEGNHSSNNISSHTNITSKNINKNYIPNYRTFKSKFFNLKHIAIGLSIIVLLAIVTNEYLTDNKSSTNKPISVESKLKENNLISSHSKSSGREDYLTNEHIYQASFFSIETMNEMCDIGIKGDLYCGTVSSFDYRHRDSWKKNVKFISKNKETYLFPYEDNHKNFTFKGKKYYANMDIGKKASLNLNCEPKCKTLPLSNQHKRFTEEKTKTYIERVMSNVGNINNARDAYIYYAASSNDEYIGSPPLDKPSGNEYFYWNCEFKMMHNEYYVCWGASKNIVSWFKNNFSNAGLSEKASTWTGDVFVFKDIRKKFTKIKQNTSYIVVGKYGENLSIELANGGKVVVPVLKDVFLFKK
ncbi:MAG: caspase family protein [Magnetococcales bacterium]|nr:caspase family protein [Magnetococcales bacterium]